MPLFRIPNNFYYSTAFFEVRKLSETNYVPIIVSLAEWQTLLEIDVSVLIEEQLSLRVRLAPS